MEREILFTGVGGQGVQLAAEVLAQAAVIEDRQVMMLGTYGGTMRGGNTDATLVIADAPISTPPIVAHAWAALAMHPRFFSPIRARLRPGSLLLRNASVFDAASRGDDAGLRVVDVAATEQAAQLGNPVVGAMLLLGAFARVTEIVALDSLLQAMRGCVPAYRRQHVELNERALAAGHAAVAAASAPAWRAEAA